MPQCPLHLGEELEPKRKGWFCEECGAIVLGYDSVPNPNPEKAPANKITVSGNKSKRRKAHSLPYAASDGTPTRPVPKAQPDLLSRKETTRWVLAAPSARSARETLRSLASSGLPTSVHVDRSGVDDVLSLSFARSRRGLLVVGPPGVGKTALLARLVNRLLGDEAKDSDEPVEVSVSAKADDALDVVIYLSGRSDYEVETAKTRAARLCDAVANCVDVRLGEFESLEDLISHLTQSEGMDPKPQRKVWLVFDGIDEARAYPELIEALDAFLPVLETHPWVRLVVSINGSTYDALAARGSEHTHAPCGAFASERWWTWFPGIGRDVPYLELKPFSPGEEVRTAYEVRQEAMALRACRVPFAELPPSTQSLLRTPLHLHLFHDAFRGRKAPPSGMDEPALIDAFLDSLAEEAPGLEKTLSRLGKTLLRRHRPDLSLELAEQWKSEWAALRADRIHKAPASPIDPIAELVSASGLMSPDTMGHGSERGQVAWRLSHPRLGEQILLRELLASIAPRIVPTGDEIVGWAKVAAGTPYDGPFTAMTGALEILVTRLVVRGESAFAKSLLEIEDPTTRTRLLSAVLLALDSVWDEDDEVPAAAKTLDVLMHVAMLRERGERLLMGAWRPLLELVGRRPCPVARELHRRLFEVARNAYSTRNNPEERLAYATTLRALGEAAHQHDDDEDARRYLDEAIRQLSDAASRKGASDAVRATLAGTYRILAAVEVDPLRIRKCHEAALRIASATDDKSQTLPSGQHRELLKSLLAVGDSLRVSAPREAEKAYEEALRASVAALVESPHRPDLGRCRAAALTGLAEVAIATHRAEDAGEKFANALRVLRKLTRREPQRWDYKLELVEVLHKQACQLRLMSADHDACQLSEESAAVMLALVHAYPQRKAWRSKLVKTLSSLGVLMRQIGEDEPARACLEDAVRHGRTLQDDPEAGRAMASALVSLVQLDEVEGRRFEARKHVDEAMVLLRVLCKDPQATSERQSLALTLVAAGQLSADDGDAEAAVGHLHEAVRMLSELITEFPDNPAIQVDLGVAVNGLRYLGGGGRVRRIPKHLFSTLVTERGGSQIREYFNRDKITIGRAPGNDLMLPNYSVSRHHAIVSFYEGTFTIEDLNSKHGTLVAGKMVNSPTSFSAATPVELGDFLLVFEGPVDTNYGALWSSMMANAPTGYPPPIEDTKPRVRSQLLAGIADDDDEVQVQVDEPEVVIEVE